MSKIKFFPVLFFAFCLLFFSESVFAIGIGVAPSVLDLETKLKSLTEAKILVYNLSDEPVIFEISVDELKNQIITEPDNFRLEAGEKKEVAVKISAKMEGITKTNLSISAMSLDRKSFSVSSGIKIPVSIKSSKENNIFLASILDIFKKNISLPAIYIIFASGFIIFLLFKFLKRKRRTIDCP